MAHRRATSNALNASVRCEQIRLQRLSETVRDNNRIPQAVRGREFQTAATGHVLSTGSPVNHGHRLASYDMHIAESKRRC